MDSLYRLLPVLEWRGEISLYVAPKYIDTAPGLGIKKISFPFSVHHSSYNTRLKYKMKRVLLETLVEEELHHFGGIGAAAVRVPTASTSAVFQISSGLHVFGSLY
jgi:hypothetical protein